MGDFEGALENYKLALKINPNFLDVYNNIGNLYYELKSFKDAEKIWSDGLKVSSNNIVLLRNLGALLFEKKGENSLAKKKFENKKILKDFKTKYKYSGDQYDLHKWNDFEKNNPDIFIGMYQFWCQKLN